MNHPLQCRCGTIQGVVENPRGANRVVCYCRDCQAFAYFLARESEILDERGGSEVIQILPKNLTLTQGLDALACMRLTERGLLRWYAPCCNTPIGNTLDTPKLSFVGLVHNCLEVAGRSLEDSFGPIRVRVNTQGARGNPKPTTRGVARTIVWFLRTTVRARLNGDYQHTPFFRAADGTPRVAPHVLSTPERQAVRNAVAAAAEHGVDG
jgi:hypothetical protein